MPELPLTRESFCGCCGQPAEGGGSTPSSAASPPNAASMSNAHARCYQQLALEPPRYCAECGRRMKVQVTPLGWRAECSRHGSLAP